MKILCTSRRSQVGSTLIEALIGALLMSITLVGSMSALNRTLVSQRYVNTQDVALLEIRESLLSDGLASVCGNGASVLPVGNYQLNLNAPTCTSPALANVGVAGQLETLPANSVPATSVNWASAGSDESRALIGGNGVLRVSF